jgi:NADH:quinone reductase (non-electrogenic)
MKSLEDALWLRNAILSALEQAADAGNTSERDDLLSFVIVGAGPTGVEMAGALAELARGFLARTPSLCRSGARIMVIDAGSRVLPEFAPELSIYAARALAALGVEVRTGKRVTGLKDGEVELSGETLHARTIIWAAGTEATPVARWLGVQPGHGGRVSVDDCLRVPGHPRIFVIGDAALAKGSDGKPLPGLATVAKQQGEYVAASIVRKIRDQPKMAGFRYRDYGTLATIGRSEAIAELGPVHLTGRPAWFIWAGAHIVFLISFRNRVVVSVQWLMAYLTNRRSAGLIVGPEPMSGQPPVVKPG